MLLTHSVMRPVLDRLSRGLSESFQAHSLQVRMSDRLAISALIVAVIALSVIMTNIAVHG